MSLSGLCIVQVVLEYKLICNKAIVKSMPIWTNCSGKCHGLCHIIKKVYPRNSPNLFI